ncbi:ATP-binding cassette domain-containing protein [Mycoplasmopsis mucosicanis]|uniref:ATP-binding cassette domain-containing protein n=1 Tax=Mycoplasmopsis mucosicanis TaxID=458208 RepID=A0A507SSZ7_9BACT|nr:ATP-binding cassette domain-containing protein [Mycoplasmopsis mucosicanis]TQC54216.1 ATP-binding cassette domain-containing protein [Mycoplasmopsis mucosicanis]
MKNNDAKLILEIQGLKKYFTNNGIINKAVNDVSFSVHEGEIVGLIGESGSGKTTVGRSLLRLYDDFNGFVTLDGQVISGKRISRRKSKFLRKNIQMIFQDPHASLNGQKNIYTTLKEPLVVNGIIKDKVNDIFKDWQEIKTNFFYTFKHKYKTLKLKNLTTINKLAAEFFQEWKQRFAFWKIDPKLSFEDNFNSFYGYLESKQNVESQIVDDLYKNTDELMNYYFQKQNDYRTSNIDFDESDLLEAKEKYYKAQKLQKISPARYEALNQRKVLKNEYIQLKKAIKEERIANTNTFNNFITEFKKDAIIYRNAKWISVDLEIYAHNIKNQLLSLKLNKVSKELKTQLPHLKYEEVRAVITSLQEYSKQFYSQHLLNISYTPQIKSNILDCISKNFFFDASSFIELNDENHIKNQEQISQLYSKMSELVKTPNNVDEFITHEEFENAKQAYQDAVAMNQKMIDEYVVEHKKRLEVLEQQISEQKLIYNSLKDIQSECNSACDQAFATFIQYINKHLHNLKTSNEQKTHVKEVQKLIKLYESKYKGKKATLKSFEFEARYLNKDIKAIKVLLGIQSDKLVENKVWKVIKHLATYPYSWLKIANLLTKTTIYKSLESVGLLKQFAFRYPHEFSGGQRQRIVIARALITQPKVIVADEPIASLDISIQAQVVNLLKDLCEQKNIGMIFIAHDLSMIEYIADRVQIMHYGKIVESGDTAKVYQRPLHPYTINLFKAIPKISNANEKFENISFELDYFKGQQYPNVPEIFEVEKDHYIYGTKAQYDEWVK